MPLDKEIPLTKAEYEICEFLAKNRGQVFSKEQEKYIDYIASSAMQIQNYVLTLIEVTRSVDGYQYRFEKIRTEDVLGDIRKQTLGLSEVFDLKINWEEQYISETVNIIYDQVVRAVMNIIKNAAEHTLKGGTEQFFMDDTSRGGGVHYVEYLMNIIVCRRMKFLNRRINKVKNVMIIVTLVLGVTACASNPMVDIYDNDSKIASNTNSYNLINCEQRIEEQNYKCSIENS